ncbi:glycosyltransferase family 39 protein [Paenibacillus radicis (ex Xue et al. 2023)]|uniref:Glycosyltransferase family 39 protein n=1 Tax=Paenibacillus radicis (ex Xue et al. 2023) TaxID=2972489 RepID=A0ABT1YUX7_9BACL|nr:glycosyltransferase family 39 protein [Paenibacillus radicis (ex Xue et al. 2023)]MCR8636743.1 glycosyltransferase family 39 protein [Paenibacillus radicis (ex Xue et al. 2023)]
MTNFQIGLHMNDILYLGYNVLLTLLLAIFKDPVAIIFIQALTAGLSVILVYKIARMLFNRRTAIVASLFYSYSWNITKWSTYILSDSFFISLLLLCVYFLLMSLESKKRIYTILFVLTSLYMMVFRPTGVVSLAFIMIYFLFRIDKQVLLDLAKKYRLVIGAVVGAAVAVLIYMIVGDKLNPLIESLQYNAKLVLYNIYAHGWIYDKESTHDYTFKPDYTINIFGSLILSFLINNWDHVLILYGRRAIAFLGWWVWETDLSTFRGITRFFWYVLPTVLFLTGTIASIVNGLFRKASIVWLVALAVYGFCILIFIDGVYRYKAPALPFLAIAAAYGVDTIIHGAKTIINNYAGKLLWAKKKY